MEMIMSTSLEGLAGAGRASGTQRNHLAALSQSLAAGARHLWEAYWGNRARRATVLLLETLDDRTLKDIVLSRAEIRPVVLGTDATGRHSYDPYWHRSGTL
jgi:uncharacterized protein YjiS (DUF1127 family)